MSATVEGLARFLINQCCLRERRGTPERRTALPFLTTMGQQIALGTATKTPVSGGPRCSKAENGRPSDWLYVDGCRSQASVASDFRLAVVREADLAPRVNIA